METYNGRKVALAKKVEKYLTKTHITEHLDMPDKLEELCALIHKWNED